MDFGNYLKELRDKQDISQRELADKSDVSNTEISRIESGERKKPSPKILKAIAPHLGTTYEDLMKKAGYIEELVDHKSYTELVYKDEDGNVADIIKQVKEMYAKDPSWTNMAFRISNELSEEDKKTIQSVAQALLNKYKK